jgi:hypothetical protein
LSLQTPLTMLSLSSTLPQDYHHCLWSESILWTPLWDHQGMVQESLSFPDSMGMS